MTQEVMNVHKALCELKLLDSRISKTIGEGIYATYNKSKISKINGLSVDEYKETIMRSSYDKAVDLINRRNAIKQAIVLSNARTLVNINGKEITVAECIDMKQNGLTYLKLLRNEMINQFKNANVIVKRENNDIEEKADRYIQTIFAEKDCKTDEMEKARQAYIDNHQYELIDIDVIKKLELLETYINNFESEVDSVLSVSNAITEITIEY